jgi:hypothetical protein
MNAAIAASLQAGLPLEAVAALFGSSCPFGDVVHCQVIFIFE